MVSYIVNDQTPLRVRDDLKGMALVMYFTIPKTLRLEPQHQIVYCHIQETC